MRVVIAGSRDFKNLYKVTAWIRTNIHSHDTVITGGAAGVDSKAEYDCKFQSKNCEIVYPDWEKYGKKAGPIRNEIMVKMADKVVVFWDGKSKGTKSTINFALKYKKNLEVIFDT